MRGSSRIYHRPYRPLNRHQEFFEPYICRLAPAKASVQIEWLDNGSDGRHTLYYGLRGGSEKIAVVAEESVVKIDGLKSDTEYEFYIEAKTGARSKTRLFRTGEIPEGAVVINYLHPEDPYYDMSGNFLGSPNLVRTKSGRLITSMDVFASWQPQNITMVFYSEDDGKSWRYQTDLYPFYWATLYYHKETLYAFGLTTEYGDLRVICSEDEGETWTDARTLFCGSNCTCKYGGMHKSPMQIVSYDGRLYMSAEYGSWEFGSHLPVVLSIDENADLSVPENWSMTEILPFDGEWEKAAGEQGDTIEGNIVVAPDGQLYNILRWKTGSFLKLKINSSDPEARLEFADITKAPVANSMFKIIRRGEGYLLITNRKTEISAQYEHRTYRNTLSLYGTRDLENFCFIKDIFNYEHIHPGIVGFQYPAVLAENDRLRLVVRSAFNNADNSHNSNYMLYCEIQEGHE